MTRPLLALLVACNVWGCGDKPIEPAPSNNPGPAIPFIPPTRKPGDLKAERADVTLTAAAMHKEWDESSAKFLEKYQNKILDITGPVLFYDLNVDGDVYLIVGSSNYKLKCEDKNALAHVAPEQTVTLRGFCEPGIGILKWTVMGATGPKPATYTAEQLVKDFTADPDGMQVKLKGKSKSVFGDPLIVTGKVEAVKDSFVFLYNPDAKVTVKCNMAFDPVMQSIAAGQKVRILGHYDSPWGVHMLNCVLLRDAP